MRMVCAAFVNWIMSDRKSRILAYISLWVVLACWCAFLWRKAVWNTLIAFCFNYYFSLSFVSKSNDFYSLGVNSSALVTVTTKKEMISTPQKQMTTPTVRP